MRRHLSGLAIRRLLREVSVTIRRMSRHPSGLAIRRSLRGVPVVDDAGMSVSSTSREFVSSPSFPSFDFHVPLEGPLAPAVGLVPVEGLASVEGLQWMTPGFHGGRKLTIIVD